MEYRTLGRTGLEVSVISFGCGDNGGLMVAGEQAERRAVVAHALESGINLFDTAAHYGNGASETNLGITLKELGAQPLISTKVHFERSDLADLNGAIRRSLDGSLKRLQMGSVDILYLHDRVAPEATDMPPGIPLTGLRHVAAAHVLEPNGILDVFEALVREGKVRWLGFCGSGSDPACLRAVLETGRFQLVQAEYNLLNPSEARPLPVGYRVTNHGGTMALADELDLPVVAYRAMAAGALALRPGAEVRPTPSRGSADWRSQVARANKLDFLKRDDDETLAGPGLRFALAHPRVATVSCGFSRSQYIDDVVRYAEQGPLSRAQLDRVEALYESNFNE